MLTRQSFLNHSARQNLFGFTFIIFFSALGLLNQAVAEEEVEEKHYEVEIIVFANADDASKEAENWKEQPRLPAIDGSVELVNWFDLLMDDAINQLPFYYQEPDYAVDETFKRYREKLEKNPKYKVLLHRAWHQTVPENSSGIPVYITSKSENMLYQTQQAPEDVTGIDEDQGFERKNAELSLDTEQAELSSESLLLQALEEEQRMIEERIKTEQQALSPLDPIMPFEDNPLIPESKPVPLSPMGPPEHKIYGTFRLSKSRYMHMNLDFIYRDEEMITEFTTYPQVTPLLITPVIVNDQPNVDNVDNFAATDFDSENTFLISPIDSADVVQNDFNIANGSLTPNQFEQQPSAPSPTKNTEISMVPLTEDIMEVELTANQIEKSPEETTEEKLLIPEKPPFIGYRLADSKRVRLSKIYYFDHPRFGIITRVSRYTPPEEIAATDGMP